MRKLLVISFALLLLFSGCAEKVKEEKAVQAKERKVAEGANATNVDTDIAEMAEVLDELQSLEKELNLSDIELDINLS